MHVGAECFALECFQGCIQDLKKGDAECISAKRTGKCWMCHAHFWSCERTCGCDQTQPHCTRSRTITSDMQNMVWGEPENMQNESLLILFSLADSVGATLISLVEFMAKKMKRIAMQRTSIVV